MENGTINYSKYLLSSFFRIIGFVFVIMSLLVLFFSAIIKSYLYFLPDAHIVLMYNRISFVIGLAFIIFSREKEEDGNAQRIRYRALLFSLMVSVMLLIIVEMINILNNNVPINAVDFMIIEMCVYYIIFRLKT